jgi:hypothetical protein
MMTLRLSPVTPAFDVSRLAGRRTKRSGVPAKADTDDARSAPAQSFTVPCDGVVESKAGNEGVRRSTPAGIARIAATGGRGHVAVSADRLIT